MSSYYTSRVASKRKDRGNKNIVTRTNCPACGRNVPVRDNKIMLHPECDCVDSLATKD